MVIEEVTSHMYFRFLEFLLCNGGVVGSLAAKYSCHGSRVRGRYSFLGVTLEPRVTQYVLVRHTL
jgi:hypothetical protein